MRTTALVVMVALVGAGALGGGCGNGALQADDADDLVAVPEGKADDFYGITATEYVLTGRDLVELGPEYATADEETRLAAVRELISLKRIALAYFATAYLVDKERKEKNANYGGMGGLAKNASYEVADIRRLGDLVYDYRFEEIVGGPADLLGLLPTTRDPDGNLVFVLSIGVPSNEELRELETDNQWFRRAPWAEWNPALADPALRRDLPVIVKAVPRTPDAWLDFPRLFADGRLTIDLHFGWDYHSAYHRKHARKVFYYLRDELGFTAPVATFDTLTPTSGPFTLRRIVGDREATVEVRIFYPKDDSLTDPDTADGGRRLEADMRDSLATADVIVFSGHSGPFYGFALANWKVTSEGDLTYEELATVDMPADRYQVVVADGCDTYQMGAQLARNPNKPGGRNVDVVTTTTYADADQPYSVMNLLRHLTDADPAGRLRPRSLRSLVLDLTDSCNNDALYGVHFVDDNPRINPYGDLSFSCQPCGDHDQCGAVGNRCVTIGASGKRCVTSCADDSACPSGYRCSRVASPSAHAVYEFACVPADFACH